MRKIAFKYMKFVAKLSNLNLVRNANSLMANQDVKIDTEVKFVSVSNVNP